MNFLFHGLLLGFGYVMPIGPQNAYVIRSSLQSGAPRSFRTAWIVSLMDISLGLACFFGIGAVIEHSHSLKQLMLASGAIFLLIIGTRLVKSKVDLGEDRKEVSQRFSDVAKACFVLTWFNPQAIIDGSLLFGGYRAALPKEDLIWFITGTALASFLWFFCLTGLVGVFRKNITPKVFQFINIGCGGILLFYAGKLGFELMKGISV